MVGKSPKLAMRAAVSALNTSVMTEQVSVQPTTSTLQHPPTPPHPPFYLIRENASVSYLCINTILSFLKNLVSSFHKPMKVNF